MKTLRDVQIGETVKVVKLHGEGPVKRRIMDMGITKGTEVYIRKVSGLHSRLIRGVSSHLEGKQRIPLSSRVAMGISWSPMCVLKGEDSN